MSRLFMRKKSSTTTSDDAEHWISTSDLMTGLMMVFLFISIAFMRHAYQERDHMKEVQNQMRDIAVAYESTQDSIYSALMDEFKEDLPKWSAKIHRDDLSIEFTDMEILFEVGSAKLKPGFKTVLDNFFPRYMERLAQFKENITEIRIEGHASTYWNATTSPDEAYTKNMILSQARTRSVLFHIQTIPEMQSQKDWVRQHMAAIGFSSSHAVRDRHGRENAEASRRVTFRVLTNADLQIRKILNKYNEGSR